MIDQVWLWVGFNVCELEMREGEIYPVPQVAGRWLVALAGNPAAAR